MREIKKLETFKYQHIFDGDSWYIQEGTCPLCKCDMGIICTETVKFCPYCGISIITPVGGKKYGMFKWDNQQEEECCL